MATVKLFFDTRRAKKDDTYALKIKLFHQDAARYIPLKFYFKKNQWNSRDQKVSSSFPNSGRVNAKIRSMLSVASDVLVEKETTLHHIGIDELKEIIFNAVFGNAQSSKKLTSIFDFAEVLINRQIKAGKIGTAEIYKTCIGAIRRYTNGKDLKISAINHNFLAEFEADALGRGIKINSVSVYLRTLRAIINKAIDEGLLKYENYPFRKFRIKQEKTAKRAISKEEIQKIIHLELDPNLRMWHSRNFFVFMFNMRGMNFIDMAYLTMENIQKERILYKRKKTGKLYNIKLTTKAAEIIQYYTKNRKPHSKERVFPILLHDRFTDIEAERKHFIDRRKKFNQDLKEIAQICEISTNLTSYVSRHSWASIAKFSGVAPAVIGESLGHSDLKTTETYLANFDHDVLDDANELITS